MASTSTGGIVSYSGPAIPPPTVKPRASGVMVRGGGGIDAREFKGLARALKLAQPVARTALLRDLKAIGEKVAKDAEIIVSQYSSTIPPTIKTQVRGESVRVRAGGGDVAIAGLFELGNTGGKKSAKAAEGGLFRHPVFGNMDNWVDQEMHPFLVPALEKNRTVILEMTLAAMDTAIKVITTA